MNNLWIKKRVNGILLGIVTCCLIIIFYKMPPLGINSNDGGTKYIQMKSFYLNDWKRLDIDYPGTKIGLDYSYLNPIRFFFVKNDKLFISYDPLFSYLSSLAYPLFGDRAIAFIPLLSFFLSLVILSKTLQLVMEKNVFYYMLMLIFLAASPVCLYSVTFWEHLPAVLMAVTGLYYCTAYFRKTESNRNLFLSSLAMSAGVFFRTEMLLFTIAYTLSLSWYLLIKKQGQRIITLTAGLLAPALAYLLFNYLAYRNPFGLHGTIHVPYNYSLIRSIVCASGFFAGYILLLLTVKFSKRENISGVCNVLIFVWVAVIFYYFKASPIASFFSLFPLFFLIFFDEQKTTKDFLTGAPDQGGVVFTTLIIFISLMAAFFLNNPDLSERYMLVCVPLAVLFFGIRSKEIFGNKPLMVLIVLLVGFSIYLNGNVFLNRIMKYTFYNATRAVFITRNTIPGDVMIFESNPLMEHAGPFYFDRIFIVLGQRHNLKDVLDTLKAKGLKRCFYWTINAVNAEQAIAKAGYKTQEIKFLSPKGPVQFMNRIELSGVRPAQEKHGDNVRV